MPIRDCDELVVCKLHPINTNDTYLNIARSVPTSELNDNLINEIHLVQWILFVLFVARSFRRAKSFPLALRVATSSPSVVDRGRWFYPL